MSTEPRGAVPLPQAGTEPVADGSIGARSGVFALPASTSFRFALLITTVSASSFVVYETIYQATPGGVVLASNVHHCASHGLSRFSACQLAAERPAALWALLGIAVLALVAVAFYCAQPWWYRHRRQLSFLTAEEAPELMKRLAQLREHAGTEPVIWLLQPLNLRLSAFSYGRFRRRFVAVSGGAAVMAVRQPAAFDAIILHELAHVKNRDINQTYLAIAVWRAFIVATLLPMAGFLIFSRQLGSPPRLLWRAAALALIVYLLRNSILRSREFDADARVAELDPDTSLSAVLAHSPPRHRRGIWHLRWVHPSAQARAAALLDPAPLFRCGFWDGLAVGLVAAIGAAAGQGIVAIAGTTRTVGDLIPAAVFAFFFGPSLGVALWRMEFRQGGTAASRGLSVGLGLGIGVAMGPVIYFGTASAQGVAPDSLRPEAIAILATWTVLNALIFMSVPAWIGYWADVWQQRAGNITSRAPARGGMLIAIVGAWIVLTIGVDLTLAYFTFVSDFNSTVLAQTWTFSGYDAARVVGTWVVCLVFITVPLCGFIARLSGRPVGNLRDTMQLWPRQARPWLRKARPVALICLAGAVMVMAITLAALAVARVRIAPAIRWNGLYFGDFLIFEDQILILVAVIFALIAAAKLTLAQSVTIAIGIGSIVAVVGTLAQMGSVAIGNCVAQFSITYNNPPASDCPGATGWLVPLMLPAAVEAALIGILFIPAARYAGILIARRGRSSSRPGLRARALRWLAAGAAAVIVIAGLAFRLPEASAHGVKPIGTIGQDGWIHGTGYEIRLFPNWYRLTRNVPRGNVWLANDATFSDIPGVLVISATAVSPATTVRVPGAHPVLLDGARTLKTVFPDYKGHFYIQWIAVHDAIEYIITFQTIPSDYTTLEHALTAMINTWHWNVASS